MYEQNENPLDELNRRLAVVRDRVRGVARGHSNGFYLFGRPGTSKTFTVLQTLSELEVPHHYQTGHLTAMGLFDLLAEQFDRVIVLDDVSEIFKQPLALQILLAALGNGPNGNKERVVRYRRQGRDAVVTFTGGIICISNLELHDSPVLEALKSRVHYLHYRPSDDQIAALMRNVAGLGWPAKEPVVTPENCLEIADFVIGESARLDVRLDMRLLMDKAFPDYLQWQMGQTETHWKDLVRTTMEEQLVELTHTPKQPRTRQEQKEMEQELVRELIRAFGSRDQRLAVWHERTSKSARAFDRRLREIR